MIFANGDSWTFGSEMVAPEFLAKDGKGIGMGNRFTFDGADYHPSNDYYRIPRIWPSCLANSMGDDVVNISWPARSNDTIFRSTIEWLQANYINPKRDTADLTVLIGWSSQERKLMLFEDLDEKLYEYTIWPAMQETKYYDHPMVKKYFQLHVTHLWTQRESLTRYIEQNFALHLFCKKHNIKHHFFNCFYVPKGEGGNFNHWKDISIEAAIKGLYDVPVSGWQDPYYSDKNEVNRILWMWESIPADVFLNKHSGLSFKGYVEQVLPHELRWCGIHPSPEAHKAWASYLLEQIVKS